MFKLPDMLPGLTSKFEDWTDYAEFLALQYGTISLSKMMKPSLLISDEIDILGIDDDDTEKLQIKVDEVAQEIHRRKRASHGRYPFELTDHDYILKFIVTDDNYFHIYNFLLFATRLNMNQNRKLESIDGTHLFERISALVAKNFFGEILKEMYLEQVRQMFKVL